MKLLLDENLPHDLRHFLPGHEVFTVAFMQWNGVTNGELLRRAATSSFDAILTKDKGFEHQHNPANLPLSVVSIKAKTNKLDDLRPLIPAILTALRGLPPQTFIRIG